MKYERIFSTNKFLDLSIPREVLRSVLKEVVDETFNCMSVDADESTSDTVMIMSSDQIPFDLFKTPQLKHELIQVHASHQLVFNHVLKL